MNYLNVTYEQLLFDFKRRLESDDRFKNIGSSSIYGMFEEMLLACMDMTNYYLQRTVEESTLDTARLDSSIIKLGKNLGYNPRRAVPAICELSIQLRGPLPENIKAGTVIVFDQELTDLNFNGNRFILDASYSYTFTEEDIKNGQSSDWVKTLKSSVPSSDTRYIPLAGISYYNTNNTSPIKCFQGEQKTQIISGSNNIKRLGKPGQYYDLNDITFSNWYGRRDPFAFYRGNYTQSKSWTQVGIGTSEEEAFKEENLFDIEEQSIFLNEKLLKLNSAPAVPLKVCQIDTNSDKTVRISFSPETTICDIGLHNSIQNSKITYSKTNKVELPNLEDSKDNPSYFNIGLKTEKDNVYVRYISTKGKTANQSGTKNSAMSFNNKFYVSSYGNVIDVSRNVQFIINSDIYGGDDFESKESIKINAPSYFSSRLKLITHDDYCTYFRALTSPINVQNALVFGEQEINDMYNNRHDLLQNNVFYCLFGHLYLKNKGDWYVKNILTDQNDNSDPLTIYSDSYKNHLSDYIMSIISYESYLKKMYEKSPEEQWLKNIQLISNNAKPKMEINSIILSLPPIIQYFDLVGKVKIKKSSDPIKYQKEMKNKIYEFLDNNAYKTREIYKSDLIGLYYDNEDTVSVDIDIKVSNIIKSDSFIFKWSSNGVGQDYEFTENKSLDSYLYTIETIFKNDQDAYGKKYDSPFNAIKIPKSDNYNKTLQASYFNKKRIMIKYTTQHNYHNNEITEEEHSIITRCESYEDDDFVYLTLPNVYDRGNFLYTDKSAPINKIPGHCDGVSFIEIYIPTTNDFFSTSNFGLSESESYKLSGNDITEVENELNKWLNNLISSESANRVIPLPYNVYSNTTITRSETITRKGNYTDTQYSQNLNEASFWRYFIKDIILNKFYSGTKNDIFRPEINEKTQYDADEWKAARVLIYDLYALVKSGICDSILDDNNNITNFSSPMEVAALQNLVDVEVES